MRTNKVRVVVTRRLPEPVETRMMELFDARLNLARMGIPTTPAGCRYTDSQRRLLER